jgi:hypothetical protein
MLLQNRCDINFKVKSKLKQLIELCCLEIVSVFHATNNHTEKSLQELLLTKLNKIHVLNLLSCISLEFILQ